MLRFHIVHILYTYLVDVLRVIKLLTKPVCFVLTSSSITFLFGMPFSSLFSQVAVLLSYLGCHFSSLFSQVAVLLSYLGKKIISLFSQVAVLLSCLFSQVTVLLGSVRCQKTLRHDMFLVK